MGSTSLTEGPVDRHVLRLTGPMTWAVLAIMSRNVVDTYFVGLLGDDALAAIGFAFPMTLTVNAVAIGLNAGAASMVSRSIGAGGGTVAVRGRDAVALSFALGLLMMGIGLVTARWGLGLLGARAQVLDDATRYLQWWFIGFPFLIVAMVVGALMRADGDAWVPSWVMIGIAGSNALLDPLLIFGWGPVPGFGIAGASMATGISAALGAAVFLVLVRRRHDLLRLSRPRGIEVWTSARLLLGVALPAAGSNMLNPAGLTLVTGVLAHFGDDTVAGFNVANRVLSLAYVGLLALSAGIGPVVGQNWGAGVIGRAEAALRFSLRVCLFYGLVIGAALFFSAPRVATLFGESTAVSAFASSMLQWIAFTIAGYGATIVGAAALNAVGYAVRGLSLTGLRMTLFVGGAGLAAWLGDPAWVPIGIAISNVAVGLLAVGTPAWLERLCRRARAR